MFLIRQAKAEDVGTLLQLARMVFFISLPPDERILAGKVQHSRDCFLRVASGGTAETQPVPPDVIAGYTADESDLFMFVIEDTDTGGVIGTAQIKAHMGGPGNPNYSFKVTPREFKSKSLGFGTTHLVGRLFKDETSPTEIGGLILQPAFRGHRDRPGRFLSFSRFHFIALHREVFAERIIAEMAPHVTSDGDNLFWDSIGRKFIPVKYSEADRFCQHNRQFIEELLPQDDIYLTLLPLEVLNQIGQAGPDTVPAKRILEKLGFRFNNFVDPFDGGPHIEANTGEISLVKGTQTKQIGSPIVAANATHRAMISVFHKDGEFRALDTDVAITGARVRTTAKAMELLMAKPGAICGVTPIEDFSSPKSTAKPAARPTARPRAQSRSRKA